LLVSARELKQVPPKLALVSSATGTEAGRATAEIARSGIPAADEPRSRDTDLGPDGETPPASLVVVTCGGRAASKPSRTEVSLDYAPA